MSRRLPGSRRFSPLGIEIFKANVKVDRGADTPDKSWFNIARKNSRFFGFDDKMLEELYKIAAENGW